MSKITTKNLHYDDTLPPFLQRLRANNASDGRHEYTVARPKKARTAEDEAEDEPVYFNEESGETLTKSEWEAQEADEEQKKAEAVEGHDGTAVAAAEGASKDGIDKEKIAAIGGSRKRKVGKVVGGEEEDEKDVRDSQKKMPKPQGKKLEKGKAAKKGKKIKLSFGDDE